MQEKQRGSGSIRIREPSATVTISRSNVYFAFGSGLLAYDCVSCGAKCCRGFSYKSIASEPARQIDMRRALPVFVKPVPEHASSQHAIGNYAPGCFFLSNDGRCEIHAEHGYDAKPETCRLFPFNNLRRLGNHLIVAPHPSLCPLGVVAGDTRSPCSEYEELFDAMASQEIHGHVPRCSAEGHPESVIADEREIVELSEQHLDCGDYVSFVKAQIRLHHTESNAAEAIDSTVDGLLSVFHELRRYWNRT